MFSLSDRAKILSGYFFQFIWNLSVEGLMETLMFENRYYPNTQHRYGILQNWKLKYGGYLHEATLTSPNV